MAPPGGPLMAPGFSRSRRHQRAKTVHGTPGEFPMNQSGLGFINRLRWAKGDWLLLNYLPSVTFNKHFRAFQYLERALKLVMTSSFFWRQTPSSTTPRIMHSLTFISSLSLFPRHQTALPSHSSRCRAGGVSHNPLGFGLFFLLCFQAFASWKNAPLSPVCSVFTPTGGHIICNQC